ncbi:MAG: DNA repair exonuclease [Candidatus ainarchaeum sp.]|nr:DNA repair exonuclease [Candidatus ainarchaeum sp.]
MLLGIFSDTHLGYGSDDRKEETFNRFKEAIDIFKQKNVDFILHAGDLFDHAVPDQETWLEAFKVFQNNEGKTSLIQKNKNGIIQNVVVKGIPIIAIHGTHEHRGKDFANAIDILEKSNCLCHVHIGYAILEKDSEKVFIHGMGGVPEKFAKKVFENYSPKPIQNSINLLLLHQSFTEFLPFDDDSIASLSLSDLPKGFDLIINGHLHWISEQNLDGINFLLCGSTIYTQMKSLESKKEKGIFLFDTILKKLEFVPFKIQRKLFYEKISFVDAKPEEVIDLVHSKINSILSNSFELKPLIRFKLVGTLVKGFSQKDISFSLPEDKAIFSITKTFEVDSFKKKINSLKELQSEKKSINEIGINLLEKNVDEAGLKEFDTREVFLLLSENELEKAERELLK